MAWASQTVYILPDQITGIAYSMREGYIAICASWGQRKEKTPLPGSDDTA